MSLPSYPAYRDIGVDWLGPVPAQWESTSLKRKARLLTEKALSKHRPVALENIEGWSGRFIDSNGDFEGEGIAFDAGDLLFAKLRPYLAKVYLADSPGEAVGDFHVLRLNEALVPRFSQYQMLQSEFISVVDGATFGSKMPRANWETLGAMPFLAPSIDEQVAIASFLDRETAKIDALIAEQKKLLALLAEKRQATISHAVTRGLDPNVQMKESGIEWMGVIPASWQVMPLGRIATSRCDGPFGSGIKSDHYTEEGALVVRLQNIQAGSFKLGAPVYLDRDYFESDLRGHEVLEGDLLIAGLGDGNNPLGRACVAPAGLGPALVKADCFRFRLRPDLALSPFVAMQLTAGAVFDAGNLATGTTRSRMPLGVMASRKVAMPPPAEQNRIVRWIQGAESKVGALELESANAIALLKERRSALISAAVTGKIDVRGLVEQNVS